MGRGSTPQKPGSPVTAPRVSMAEGTRQRPETPTPMRREGGVHGPRHADARVEHDGYGAASSRALINAPRTNRVHVRKTPSLAIGGSAHRPPSTRRTGSTSKLSHRGRSLPASVLCLDHRKCDAMSHPCAAAPASRCECVTRTCPARRCGPFGPQCAARTARLHVAGPGQVPRIHAQNGSPHPMRPFRAAFRAQ